MTRSSPGQFSFSSGEISPLLAARADYQRFQTGLSKCRGFIPLRQGGVTRAPGTWYRGRTLGDLKSRLIPFQFAADDAVVLEFTDLRMRVWRYGELVLVAGIPFELTTPYPQARLDNLQWVQSADVIYLVDGSRPPQKLSRFALDNWTIADVNFRTGPVRLENDDTGVTISASGATGSITLSGVGGPFTANMVDSLIQLRPEDYGSVPLWTGNLAVTVGDLCRYDGNIYELTAGTNTGVNPPIHLKGTEVYDAVNGTAWKYLSGGVGIVKVTAFTNANSVTANVVKRLPAPLVGVPTYLWALDAWSEKYGYPAAIEIYEQRLVAAATPTDPRTLWFSTAGLFEDFEGSTEADGSFAYAIAGRNSLNKVLWLKAGARGLHIGALGEEYSTRSNTQGQIIGPTPAQIGLDSSIGSLPMSPIAPDGKPIFISRDGARIIEMAYAFEQDANTARELSLPAEHFGQKTFKEIVWQSAPLRLCWIRRTGGDLAVMVYDPTEDVLGWATYPLAGGLVEAMAVTQSADGSSDILTLQVRRTINGATVRTIEEQAVTYGVVAGDDPLWEANHLFCAVRFAPGSPTNTFSVPHLVGQSVTVWTEKGEFGPITVAADGSVTIEDIVSHAIIGLFDATAEVETLDIQAPARDGYSMGRKKRLHKGTGVVVHRTCGARVRPNEYEFGETMVPGTAEDLIDIAIASNPANAFSGPLQTNVITGPVQKVTLSFLPIGAQPMTVLAVIPRIEEVGS